MAEMVISRNEDILAIYGLGTQILKQRIIPIVARDVGGDFGSIVEFYVKTGQMYIKTVSGDIKVI